MSQALYRKWRPRRWEAVVGQDHVVRTLRNAVATERVGHAYLFAGPRGTGKTTTARLLAKAVNCLDPDPANRPCDRCDHCQAVTAGRFLDLIEIDAASNTSVDDVRSLRDKINFSPNQGRYKVYVVDEVHMLSTAAFNALLKTLEEPPPHAIFVLATTEAHKIPATVLSRCQRHEFRRIPVTEISTYLEEIAGKEGLQVSPEALLLIARQSTGSLRDALSLLDQLASTGEEINLELAQTVLGTATSQAVINVVELMLARDIGRGIDQIHRALDSGSDPRQLSRQMVDYLRGLLLIQVAPDFESVDVPSEVSELMRQHAGALSTDELVRDIRLFNQAANDARAAWHPALPLEVAFIEAVHPFTQTAPPPGVPKGSRTTSPPKTTETTNPAKKSQPQSAPPSDEGAADPSSEDRSATQALNQNWPIILSQVRKTSPNTYGLLNSCRSRYMDGNLLVLGFASDVLKNQMSKKENLALVQEAASQVLGKEIAIRCMINTAKRTAIPPDVDEDGMVAAALRDLGGEIVDVQ
jgi:DNA polymerase III subunit gamma/tau